MTERHRGADLVRLAQSAGGLAKSMSVFSLAAGAFTLRQAGRLLRMAGSDIASAGAEASAAVERRARTALEIGANVQSGVVDACVDFAGFGAQAPESGTTALAIPLRIAAARRVSGMQTVGEGARREPVRQSEFVRRLRDLHDDALDYSTERERIVDALWRSEGLAGSVARRRLRENTMRGAALARQALPVIHVGFGSGAAEALAFDAPTLRSVFDECCEKAFEDFSYEGIGAALRFYERGFFKLASAALDFIHLDAPRAPDSSGFFAGYLASYTPREQRLIAHGYGRIVAFSHLTIEAAIGEAAALPYDRIEPAVHGAAFAFAMINVAELPWILQRSAIPHAPKIRAAFQNGLVYALVFLDWYVPGLLAAWTPQPGLETELVEHARREAALASARGYPLAFRLADPQG